MGMIIFIMLLIRPRYGVNNNAFRRLLLVDPTFAIKSPIVLFKEYIFDVIFIRFSWDIPLNANIAELEMEWWAEVQFKEVAMGRKNGVASERGSPSSSKSVLFRGGRCV